MMSKVERAVCLGLALFFEPQTGIYKSEDWQSNFYHFRLDVRFSWSTMTTDWIDKNIKLATVGSGGLEYQPAFLEKLAQFEASTDRLDKSAARLGINAPRKLENSQEQQTEL